MLKYLRTYKCKRCDVLMAKIISLVNQKGGVGKTTTSINLAASLGKIGKKTLLIDLDPQGNASTSLGINKGSLKYCTYDVIMGKCDIKDAIIKTRFDKLYILPATIALSKIDKELSRIEEANSDFNVNEKLKLALNGIKDTFEYVIIDCPPSLGASVKNALSASNAAIIVVQCEYLPLEGLSQVLNTIITVKNENNQDLAVEGVLLTLFDPRTNMSFEVAEEVRKYFGNKTFNTIIPRSIRVAEAPSHGLPIYEYDPLGRATEAYFNLAKEVIERDGN